MSAGSAHNCAIDSAGAIACWGADADHLFLAEGNDVVGLAVAGVGDVDSDGLADLLVGAPRTGSGNDKRKGATYLVLGASLGSTTEIDLTDADYFFTGEVKSDYSGRAVSSAGDVDGDGRDDILVGAIDDTSGKAYLIFSGL